MNNRVFANLSPKNFSIKRKEDQLKFVGCVMKFMGGINLFGNPWDDDDEKKAKMQFLQDSQMQFTVSSELPGKEGPWKDKIKRIQPPMDTSWLRIFEFEDMSGSSEKGVNLMDVKDGITFKKMKEGDKINYAPIAGDSTFVTFDFFGGGVQIPGQLIKTNDFFNIQKLLRRYRAKQAKYIPKVAFGMIEAISSTYDIPLQTPAGIPTTSENRRILQLAATINKSCVELAYYADEEDLEWDSVFVIVTPLELASDLSAALAMRFPNSDKKICPFNCEIVSTTKFNNREDFYTCIPRNSTGGAQLMDFSMWEKFDSQTFSFQVDGWFSFCLWIADQAQFRRCHSS